MDWKKIMNKKLVQADGKEPAPGEKEDTTAEMITGEAVQEYLTQLLPELNLRLLWEAESSAMRFLWVESAIVTSYQSVPAAAGAAETGNLTGRIWNRLTGMLGRARSLKK